MSFCIIPPSANWKTCQYSLSSLLLVYFWDYSIIMSFPSPPSNHSIHSFLSFKFMILLVINCCPMQHVFLSKACSVCMLLVCMFSRLTTWYWITISVFFPGGGDYFSLSQHFPVAYNFCVGFRPQRLYPTVLYLDHNAFFKCTIVIVKNFRNILQSLGENESWIQQSSNPEEFREFYAAMWAHITENEDNVFQGQCVGTLLTSRLSVFFI